MEKKTENTIRRLEIDEALGLESKHRPDVTSLMAPQSVVETP